jgi:phospholipid/cholesterol/gamma-HCH transport system permease protein
VPKSDIFQVLGGRVLTFFAHTTGALALVVEAARALPGLAQRPVRLVFYRQIYFTGVQALFVVAAIGLVLGLAITTQVSSLAGRTSDLIGRILVWVVVRELGPLFAAIIVIARSGTAIAAELGSMKVGGEVRYLRAMGIPAARYLVMPRIAGLTTSLLALLFFFQGTAVLGGLALSALLFDLPLRVQLDHLAGTLSFFDLSISLVKGLVFGLVIAAAACYHGLRVRSSITEVPQAAGRAVIEALSLVLVVNGFITVASFL